MTIPPDRPTVNASPGASAPPGDRVEYPRPDGTPITVMDCKREEL